MHPNLVTGLGMRLQFPFKLDTNITRLVWWTELSEISADSQEKTGLLVGCVCPSVKIKVHIYLLYVILVFRHSRAIFTKQFR